MVVAELISYPTTWYLFAYIDYLIITVYLARQIHQTHHQAARLFT